MKRISLLSVALFLGLGLMQAHESRTPNASSEATKKENEVVFVAPGEGRYTFNFNEDTPTQNNVMFKWSPKTADAVLLIKSGDEVLDEIQVRNTDHIKLNLAKYSAHRVLSWNLTIGDSQKEVEGEIVIRKFVPPFNYIFR